MNVASLLADIGIDFTGLQDGLKAADKLFADFKKRTDTVLKKIERGFDGVVKGLKTVAKGIVGVTAAITGAAAGVFALVKATADYGDEVSKNARRTGLTVEQYQELAFAAKEAGVESEQLNVGLAALNKNIYAAGNGNAAASKRFEDLGISVRDSNGNLKTANDIVRELADVFSGFEDGPEKSARALELMGESGARLINVLNGGTGALDEQAAAARELGVVMSGQAAAASEAFNDSLGRLGDAFRGIRNAIGAELLPILTEWINKATEYLTTHREQIKNTVISIWKQFEQIVKDVFNAFTGNDSEVVNTWILSLRDNLRELNKSLGLVIEKIKILSEFKVKNLFVPPDGSSFTDDVIRQGNAARGLSNPVDSSKLREISVAANRVSTLDRRSSVGAYSEYGGFSSAGQTVNFTVNGGPAEPFAEVNPGGIVRLKAQLAARYKT